MKRKGPGPNIKVIHFERSHRRKAIALSIALHGGFLLLISGTILIPASRLSPHSSAFSGTTVELDPATAADTLFSPQPEDDPLDLASQALPEDFSSDPIANTDTTNPDQPPGPLVREADLAQLASSPGMGPLIQLPSSFTAPVSLPEAIGRGVGNVFGPGEGFASGQGGTGGGGTGGPGGPGTYPGPAQPPSNLTDANRGELFDGWIYLGKDQDNRDTFINPRQSYVIYQDDNVYGNIPTRAKWLDIFNRHNVRLRPMGHKMGDAYLHLPEWTTDESKPFIFHSILQGLIFARRRQIPTIVVMHRYVVALEDHPPHVRAVYKQFEELRALGIEVIFALMEHDTDHLTRRKLIENGHRLVFVGDHKRDVHYFESMNNSEFTYWRLKQEAKKHGRAFIEDRIERWTLNENRCAAVWSKKLGVKADDLHPDFWSY